MQGALIKAETNVLHLFVLPWAHYNHKCSVCVLGKPGSHDSRCHSKATKLIENQILITGSKITTI